MEVDEKVRSWLVEGFERWRDEIVWIIDTRIGDMKDANTVEELTRVKRDLLIELVKRLPLGYFECYFCLAGKKCYECKYAKYHSKCSDENSTYDRIRKARNKLIVELEKYYQGETYE